MTTIALTIYVLIWPLIVATVLGILGTAFFREWAAARREGRPLV